MESTGFSSHGMVPFGTSSLPDGNSVGGFEELAMPLFDSLYNFARWLTQNREEAEDLVQETFCVNCLCFFFDDGAENTRFWVD